MNLFPVCIYTADQISLKREKGRDDEKSMIARSGV